MRLLSSFLKNNSALRNRSGRMPSRYWVPVLTLLAGVFAPALNGQIPRPGFGSSVTPGEEQVAPTPPAGVAVPTFQFRSGFWVNLHHFLYYQARLQSGLALAPGAEAKPGAAKPASLADLSPAERKAWQNAVDYYVQNFASAELPYNGSLAEIDDRLSDMASCPDLDERSSSACAAGIDPGLVAVLDEAAPAYRAHWWTQQNQANQAWISNAVALFHQYGAQPALGLSRVFKSTWPARPIPVDVVNYASASGSYTTLGPPHIFIAASSARDQGLALLEGIFREASEVVAEPVETAIIQQCRKQTKPIPRDLWHALASYTTAEVFERSFSGQALPEGVGSISFAQIDRKYMSLRGWKYYRQLLERYWQPYLDHRTDMQSAIGQMVSAL